MARGEMVRYLAENDVQEPEGIKGFDRLGYCFDEALSSEREYVFLKKGAADGRGDSLKKRLFLQIKAEHLGYGGKSYVQCIRKKI